MLFGVVKSKVALDGALSEKIFKIINKYKLYK